VEAVGDRWVTEKRSLLLRVPSTVIPRQPNFLLKPQHPDLASLVIDKLEPFRFDPRLQRSS
jgi:RES domain-containing protein